MEFSVGFAFESNSTHRNSTCRWYIIWILYMWTRTAWMHGNNPFIFNHGAVKGGQRSKCLRTVCIVEITGNRVGGCQNIQIDSDFLGHHSKNIHSDWLSNLNWKCHCKIWPFPCNFCLFSQPKRNCNILGFFPFFYYARSNWREAKIWSN